MAHPKPSVVVAIIAFVLLAASAGAAFADASWPDAATAAPLHGPDAPNLVYRLVERDAVERDAVAPATPQTETPNAVTAHSFRAASITPNAALYVAALLIMAAALWAAIYRLGRRA